MSYVRLPAKDSNVWVDPKSVLSLEFQDMPEPGSKPKKGKKAEPSLIAIPDKYRRIPRCTLHLHNMQVIQFEMQPDATEMDVLSLLDQRHGW